MPARRIWPRQSYGFTKTKLASEVQRGDQPDVHAEFRNRLTIRWLRSITCRSRSSRRVVDKFVMQLEAQLADRAVTVELTDEARDWLVENGYDEAMGARPMARLIQQTIKTPLADELLFGRLKDGGAVRVVVVGSENRHQGAWARYPAGPVTPIAREGGGRAGLGQARQAQARRCGDAGRSTQG